MAIKNPERICAECGQPFTAHQGLQAFCCADHRKAFYDRNAKRFKTLAPIIQTWRAGKNGASKDAASYAFTMMCASLDAMNAEDRAAGRRPDVLVRAKMQGGWRPGDKAGWRAAHLEPGV